jgi:hypothetical protein
MLAAVMAVTVNVVTPVAMTSEPVAARAAMRPDLCILRPPCER